MAENSKIEWCDHTFNPWIGCTRVSPGCGNCYAETLMDKRLGRARWGPGQPRVRTSGSNWDGPRKWNRQAAEAETRYRVFCASLADVFDHEVSNQWRSDLYRLIRETPHLDWLLLTKRIDQARQRIPVLWFEGEWPDNAWLGTTIENQAAADERIPLLLDCPAPVRFLSCEPLLGEVNLRLRYDGVPLNQWNIPAGPCGYYCDLGEDGGDHIDHAHNRIDWVICGGESGPGARPMHPEWARSLRDQCRDADVPFLFKQWGAWRPLDPGEKPAGESWFVDSKGRIKELCEAVDTSSGDTLMVKLGKKRSGRLLDGKTWDQFPVVKS